MKKTIALLIVFNLLLLAFGSTKSPEPYGIEDVLNYQEPLREDVPPVFESLRLEAEVWVDDDFDDQTTGWNVTRFDNITDALAAVDNHGTINVAEGSYLEQVVIEKPVTINGSGPNSVIVANHDITYTGYPGMSGGSNKSAIVQVNNVWGTGNQVSLNNFQIDSSARTDHNLYGIHSTGSNIEIDAVILNGGDVRMYNSILIYPFVFGREVSCSVTNCEAYGYYKNGITANCNGVTAEFISNTVYGYVATDSTEVAAQNGYQIGWGAEGSVIDNILLAGVYYLGVDWAATGILIWNTNKYGSDPIEDYGTDHDFLLSGNNVINCETGYAVYCGFEGTTAIVENNTLNYDQVSGNCDGVVFGTWGDYPSDLTLTSSGNLVTKDPSVAQVISAFYVGRWDDTASIYLTTNNEVINGADSGYYLDSSSGSNAIFANMQNMEFNSCGIGIEIDGNGEIDVINSEFSSSATAGIKAYDGANIANINIESCDFSGESVLGILNADTGTQDIDAEYNFWGADVNPSGLISGNVDYSPWYTDAEMTNLAHPAAQNVTVSKSGTDVTLNWDAWGDTETYEVYKTTGNPYLSTGWTNVSAGVTLTEVTLNEQTADYAFYRVCLTGEEDYVENDVVGYYTVNCDINNDNTDLNFISIPFSTDYANASDYVQNVIGTANCNTISKWVDSAQAWQTATYVSELSMWFGDFAIEENGAYLMGCTTDNLSYVVTGYLPVMPEYTLVTGNNLIMVPMDVAANTDSGTFYDDEFDLEVGDTISNWSVSGQTWSTRTYGGSSWEGTQFNVNPGYPVMAGE